MVAETQSANTNTRTDDATPSMSVRKSSLVLPKLMRIDSSSVRIQGKKPAIQSTAPIQASQDTVRSTRKAKSERGNTACTTRAIKRMSAKDISTGKAK